jgi:hypothetical protein
MGFKGTIEEWLASLKGEPGEPGEPGKSYEIEEPVINNNLVFRDD